jgi:hypothetical protein
MEYQHKLYASYHGKLAIRQFEKIYDIFLFKHTNHNIELSKQFKKLLEDDGENIENKVHTWRLVPNKICTFVQCKMVVLTVILGEYIPENTIYIHYYDSDKLSYEQLQAIFPTKKVILYK